MISRGINLQDDRVKATSGSNAHGSRLDPIVASGHPDQPVNKETTQFEQRYGHKKSCAGSQDAFHSHLASGFSVGDGLSL